MREKAYSLEVGGKTMTASFSDLAGKANGSVMLRLGDTVVLATAVAGKAPRPGVDFLPLTVDYEERFYASGEILGSRFLRREGKPSDTAILSGRMVDRSIRPLFDRRMREDVQIVITVLSMGTEDPDMLAMNAASLALSVSDIPWRGPIGAVRVSIEKEGDELAINPPYGNGNDRALDLIVAGKDGRVVMIEGGAREAAEAAVEAALARAMEEIAALEAWEIQITKELGKAKRATSFPEASAAARALFEKEIAPEMERAVFSGEPGSRRIETLEEKWQALAATELPDEPRGSLAFLFENAVNETLRREGIASGARADGRKEGELRPLFASPGGISAVLHGSGFFYRGETHVLSVLTLGGPGAAQLVDGMELKEKKRFMHHYNFPPFSAGETGKIGNVNRREVGHGALAERALWAILPDIAAFPYTIRLVSESMSSNGSTSMASVCAASLALHDGGVPVSGHAAGVAVGLLFEDEKRYRLLTDIQGPEDRHGDMDFKVAGTEKGVTALQLDIKTDGVPPAVIGKALDAARAARGKVLATLREAIAAPRRSLSAHAPRVRVLRVPPEKIGLIIGPGGKTIHGIKARTGVADIAVEQTGAVTIVGKEEGVERAAREVETLARAADNHANRP